MDLILFKAIKKVLKILRIIVLILILLNFIPVKFAVQPENIDYTKEFYMVHFQRENECYIRGDKNGLYNLNIPVNLSGKDPREKISSFIYLSGNYVIYGTLEQKGNNHYILHSEKWNPLISIGLSAGRGRQFLSIYDYDIIDSDSAVLFSHIVIIASVMLALLEKFFVMKFYQEH